MKKSIRNVLCCGALFCTLTLTSCFDDPEGIKSAVIENGETTVYVNGNYDYSGLTLNVTKNNGEHEVVNITEDMIKQKLDLTSAGKKVIVVEYDGKQYRLTVNVVANPADQVFYDKIQSLIGEISNNSKEAKSIKITIKTNGDAPNIEDMINGETGSQIDISNVLNKEISFNLTKEQINNQELVKALALLQLSIDNGDVVVDGDDVYASVDINTIMSGLEDIAVNNADYFKNLALSTIFSTQNVQMISMAITNLMFVNIDDMSKMQISSNVANVINSIVQKGDIKSSVKGLVVAVEKVDGASDKDAVAFADALLKDDNIFTNIVEAMNVKGLFALPDDSTGTKVDILDEQMAERFYTSCKNVAVQLDNVLSDRQDTLASTVVSELATFEEVVPAVIGATGSEELAEFYGYYMSAIKPILTEQNIDDFVTQFKAFKAMSFEEIKASLINAINSIFTSQNLEQVKEQLIATLTSTKTVNAFSALLAEYIELNNGVEVGSTSLAEKIANFANKTIAGVDTVQEEKALALEYAKLKGLDETNVTNAFDYAVETKDFFTSVIDLIKDEGGFDEVSFAWSEDAGEYVATKEFTELSQKNYEAARAIAQEVDNFINHRDEVHLLKVYYNTGLTLSLSNLNNYKLELEESLSLIQEAVDELQASVNEANARLQELEESLSSASESEKEQITYEIKELEDSILSCQNALSSYQYDYDLYTERLNETNLSINFINTIKDELIELGTQLDNLFNGKDETVATAVLDFMDAFNTALGENASLFADNPMIMIVNSFFNTYFKPQITEDGINAIIANLKAFPNMSIEEICNKLASDFAYFANNDGTKSFVNNMTQLVLGMYLQEHSNGNDDFIYDEFFDLQQYIIDIKDRIVDFIYEPNKDVAQFMADIKQIMDENDFETNLPEVYSQFMYLNSNVQMVQGFVNCFTNEVITDSDRQYFATVASIVLQINVDADTALTTAQSLNTYLNSIRTALSNEQNKVPDKVVGIISATNTLLTSVDANKQVTAVVKFVDGVIKDYNQNDNHKIDLYTKYCDLILSLQGDSSLTNEEKAIVLKLANIVDNIENYTDAEKLKADIVELISLPNFSEFMAKSFETESEYFQMARIFLYVVLDVQDVDYNELMSDLQDILPSELASIDFNEFIAHLKEVNYSNMFTINDVKVSLIEDSQGNVIGQKAVFYANFNFDAYIDEITAGFTFEIEMSY